MKRKRTKKNRKTRKISFYQKYKKIIIISVIGVLFISIIYAMNSLSDKDSIIMITDSKACHCVKNRCFSLKNQISDLLKQKFNNNIKFKVIEYMDKPRSEKIMKKYNMGMVPAVVIINKKGEVIYNGNFYSFNIDDFINKLYELKEKAIK